jgi:hypothetical protein
MRLRLLLLCCLGIAACNGGGSAAPAGPPVVPPTPYGIEIVVRTPTTLRNAQDVATLVDQAVLHGVAVINLMAKQDEDGSTPSGQVYYRSSIAPAAAGYEQFDVLQALLDAARGKPLRVRAWLPQFHDQVAALRNPAWAMQALQGGSITPYTGSRHTEFFVNPLLAEVQDYELSLITEVTRRYAVDGVMLDWIRFDNFNMDLGPDTRQRYLAEHGQDPAGITFNTDNAERTRWNAWRTDGIARYVQRVRQAVPAGMALGVYILPPEFVEVGQDAAKFNTASSPIAPMCYFRDWGYAMEWVWNSCLPSTVQKAGAADVVPVMDANLSDDQYHALLAQMRQRFPQVKTLAWFQHGAWDAALLQRIAQRSTW